MEKVISKVKGKSVVTPAGSALWVKVLEPEYRFDKEKGEYEAQIVVNPKDEKVAAYIAGMQKMADAALAEARENLKPPKNKSVVARDVVTLEYDKDGNETGNVIIKAKAKAIDFDGNPFKVDIYNVKGQKEDDWSTLIGNGSTIKLQAWVGPYYMANGNTVGLTAKLKKVQVLDLVSYDDAGFGDESGEEGFGDDGESFEATDGDF